MYQNVILATLPESEYASLSPHLGWATLDAGQVLHEFGCRICDKILNDETAVVETGAFLSGLTEDWSVSVGMHPISLEVKVEPHYVPASRAVEWGIQCARAG